MANRCYCGESAAYPWCDGSHAHLGRQSAEDDAMPAVADGGGESGEGAPRQGWLARLFGLKRRDR